MASQGCGYANAKTKQNDTTLKPYRPVVAEYNSAILYTTTIVTKHNSYKQNDFRREGARPLLNLAGRITGASILEGDKPPLYEF